MLPQLSRVGTQLLLALIVSSGLVAIVGLLRKPRLRDGLRGAYGYSMESGPEGETTGQGWPPWEYRIAHLGLAFGFVLLGYFTIKTVAGGADMIAEPLIHLREALTANPSQ